MTIQQNKKKSKNKAKKRHDSQIEAQRNIYLEEDALQLLLSDGFPTPVTFNELRSWNATGFAGFYLRKIFKK